MSIVTIFSQTPKLSKVVSEYLKITQSLSSKLDKLLEKDFEAAKMNLDQAGNAQSLEERKQLLRNARSHFIQAVSLAKGIPKKEEDLVCTYLGMAMCNYQLGEFLNAKKSLEDILDMELTTPMVVLEEKVSGITDLMSNPLAIGVGVILTIIVLSILISPYAAGYIIGGLGMAAAFAYGLGVFKATKFAGESLAKGAKGAENLILRAKIEKLKEFKISVTKILNDDNLWS
jgi:predicted transcriptional regulator